MTLCPHRVTVLTTHDAAGAQATRQTTPSWTVNERGERFGFRGAWPQLMLRAGVLKRFSPVMERETKDWGDRGDGGDERRPSIVGDTLHTAQRC